MAFKFSSVERLRPEDQLFFDFPLRINMLPATDGRDVVAARVAALAPEAIERFVAKRAQGMTDGPLDCTEAGMAERTGLARPGFAFVEEAMTEAAPTIIGQQQRLTEIEYA